jgi:trigger factor
MQVSVESTSALERRLTITVPAARVDSEFNERLNKTARTVRMDGFRPGKAPMSVIKKRFGEAVRQEAVGDLIRDCFFEAVVKEKINPAGYPTIDAVKDQDDGAVQFVAVFEVYPEVTLASFADLAIERPVATVNDADVDTMIESLRKQRATFAESADAAKDGDRLDIDFEGSVDGVVFEGGTAKGFSLVLGSNRMIPGFESGLVGAKAGEDRQLNVTFPEDYQAENLRGKAALFAVKVNKVESSVLPALDETFFKSFNAKEPALDVFRADVRKNMDRELKHGVKNKTKTQVFDALLAANSIDVPKAMIDSEIDRLRQNMLSQFGASAKNINPSMLPNELFAEQAKRGASLGLLMAEVMKKADLKVDATRVKAFIDEIAESYEQPKDVIDWYYGNKEQLQQVESVVLEDQVVEYILAQAKVSEKAVTYEEVLKNQKA